MVQASVDEFHLSHDAIDRGRDCGGGCRINNADHGGDAPS
jgi:hypothetical protein